MSNLSLYTDYIDIVSVLATSVSQIQRITEFAACDVSSLEMLLYSTVYNGNTKYIYPKRSFGLTDSYTLSKIVDYLILDLLSF